MLLSIRAHTHFLKDRFTWKPRSLNGETALYESKSLEIYLSVFWTEKSIVSIRYEEIFFY